MAGVTNTGWIAKTLPELYDEAQEEAKVQFGESFPTTPESAFGQLAAIILAPIKDTWDLGQAITNTQRRDTAEGTYLDYLADLVGLTRKQASGSNGYLWFTGTSGTAITANTAVKDLSSRVVLTDTAISLNRANCYSSSFTVNNIQDLTDYTITVEGVICTYTSGVNATKTTILGGLKSSLDANTEMTSTVTEDVLQVVYPSYNNIMTSTNTSNLTLKSVGVVVTGTAATEGALSFEVGTVTKLVTVNLGVSTVTNPADFTVGESAETDAELRLRMAEREQSTGTATKPSIEASLLEVTGVTSAYIVVNDTLTLDTTTGVPAKSFETFVSGGDEEAIADVLWESKPVLGQTHGDISKTIIDANGDTQSVKFSRDAENFAWLRVTYSLNEEETFPDTGESQMRNNVVTKGEEMYRGENLVASKFYGSLYEVEGVIITSIEIAVTQQSTDTPVFQTAPIEVPVTTFLSFDTSRVELTT